MIPTTAGTGSEMSDGSILSDENHIKQNFISDEGAFAEFAIVDPELMAGMPPKLTASTGLDALAHAIESYMGTLTNGFIQFNAEKAIDEIAEFLPRAVENGSDMEAREKMAVSSFGSRLSPGLRTHLRRTFHRPDSGRIFQYSAWHGMCLRASVGM